MTREELLTLLRRKGAPRPADVAALALPCLSLETVPSDGAARTHLGGVPDLAGHQPWPRNRSGQPMTFIGQVDLGELASTAIAGELPAKGLLGWFVDTASHGVPEFAMTLATDATTRAVLPADVALLAPRSVIYRAGWSLPPSRANCPFTWDFDARDAQAYREFRNAWDLEEPSGHTLLGYAGGLDDPYVGTALDLDAELHARWFARPVRERLLTAEFAASARAFRMCAQFWAEDMDWADGAPLTFLLHVDAWANGRFQQSAATREAAIWLAGS